MSEKKLVLKQPVIVEGKYDKIKLESVVNAKVITLDGFRIFNNQEKQFLMVHQENLHLFQHQ